MNIREEKQMNCSKILDMAYQYWHPVGASENEPHSEISTTAIFCQIQIWLHTFFCSDCAKEIERFQLARDVMQRDFFPSSPGFEDSIMARIQAEVQIDTVESAAPGGFYTRMGNCRYCHAGLVCNRFLWL